MSSPALAADVLAALIALGVPLTGPLERRIYRSNPATPVKLLTYGANIVLLWALAVAAVWIDGWARLSASLADGMAWLWAPAVSGPALGLGVAAYMVLALLPLIQSLRGPRRRQAYAAAYRRGFADIPGLLPNTAVERMAFVLVSLTAGLCEEVFCRGFLIRYLQEAVPAAPLAAALAVSALIFGLGHLYQGLKGVVGAAVGGLAFGALFLLTGSLIPGIILHALIDLQVAYVLRPAPAVTDLEAQAA